MPSRLFVLDEPSKGLSRKLQPQEEMSVLKCITLPGNFRDTQDLTGGGSDARTW